MATSVMGVVIGIAIGVGAIVCIVTIATIILSFVLKKASTKNEKSKDILFLGKLANTDASINDAINYLKLTNGLTNNEDRECAK